MADLFSTNVMMGVVQSLLNPPSFLLDRFFPSVQTEGSEEIHFDLIDRTRRLAPFVSPLVEGKVVAGQGFTTKTFKPAYIKDKRVWDGQRALKRSAGEQIGGSLAPLDRMRAILANELQDQLQMLTRRLEWMAAQVLTLGKVTVVGDQYPSSLVDFLRDSSLTVALTGNAKWDQATTSHPLNDLQTWALLVLKLCGAMPVDVVMDVDSWVLFKNHADVKDRIGLQRRLGELPTLDQSAIMQEGGVYMGSVDGFNIWAYAGWYMDDNNAIQPMFPSGTVVMGTPQIQGVRAYGAIRDEAAGYQAVPYFPKSWVQDDPAVRFIMMQSAPLVVPTRVNASFCATVK